MTQPTLNRLVALAPQKCNLNSCRRDTEGDGLIVRRERWKVQSGDPNGQVTIITHGNEAHSRTKNQDKRRIFEELLINVAPCVEVKWADGTKGKHCLIQEPSGP